MEKESDPLETVEGSYTLLGQPYEEEGYTASDDVDGDLTGEVERVEADGAVYYTVTDSAGNRSEVRREIRYDDPEPPELTLKAQASMSIEAGEGYSEPGWTAVDNVGGDISDRVEVSGWVNAAVPGEYVLTYTVEDGYHNQASAVRRVTVRERPKPVEPAPDDPVPSDKNIYLTFDDGPGRYTRELLDVLDKYNVKVTFFVVKTGYTDLIAKEAAAGHSVGIHSATHDYQKIYANEEAYFRDLEAMDAVIYEKTGQHTKLLRFPGGSSNRVSGFNPGIMTRLTQAVQERGYQYFDWNVLSGDAGETTDTDVVYQNVIDGVTGRKNSIVLMHDIKGYSVAAVERIIRWGLENGYTFLPLTPDSPTAHHRINN